MRFAFIADQAAIKAYPVSFMCRMLEVSPAGYYAWATRKPSRHEISDSVLSAKIKTIFKAHKSRYGVRRIQAELKSQGQSVSYKRVLRLMRHMRLRSIHRRAYMRTTLPDRSTGDLGDLVKRDFCPKHANHTWVGDITYLRVESGFAYLATVIDCYSRKVVGWAIADHMKTSLVQGALAMALSNRCSPRGVIFHSDRGAQFTSRSFRSYCQVNGVRPSVGRTGSCFDNAVAESLFATLKKELIHTQRWRDLNEIRSALFAYIEIYYNRIRRHSSLNYKSPSEYEDELDRRSSLAA